jgi:Tol biopolymer transport system component
MIEHVAWLADGTRLLLIGAVLQNQGINDQIWSVSYPEGEISRVTNDLSNYTGLSLTADSSAFVAMQEDYVSNVWIAPRGDISKARRITSSKLDGMNEIAWTPGGKIIYCSRSGENWELSTVDADGNNRRQLTFKTGNSFSPVVTSDGRYVVFISDRAGKLNLWRMTLDGNEVKQLTNDRGDSWPDCTPDGKWVLYCTRADSPDNSPNIWKVPIEGGEPILLTNAPSSFVSSVSPDGKLVAFSTWVKEDMQHHLAVMSIEGGPPIRVFDPPSANVRWSPDGRVLQYITWPVSDEGATSRIWSQPIDGGPPKQIVDVSPDVLFSFAWSPDGKQLAYARGSVTRDVVLITNFK